MLYTQVNYSQVDYLEHKKETNFLYINADKQGKVLSGEDTNTVQCTRILWYKYCTVYAHLVIQNG